jgi:hypothetical protein
LGVLVTQLQVQGFIIVLTIGFVANAALIGFLLRQIKALRRDVIAAGIDIHQELVEANVHHRLAAMNSGPAPGRSDSPRSPDHLQPGPVAIEQAERWLELQRQKMGARRRG